MGFRLLASNENLAVVKVDVPKRIPLVDGLRTLCVWTAHVDRLISDCPILDLPILDRPIPDRPFWAPTFFNFDYETIEVYFRFLRYNISVIISLYLVRMTLKTKMCSVTVKFINFKIEFFDSAISNELSLIQYRRILHLSFGSYNEPFVQKVPKMSTKHNIYIRNW